MSGDEVRYEKKVKRLRDRAESYGDRMFAKFKLDMLPPEVRDEALGRTLLQRVGVRRVFARGLGFGFSMGMRYGVNVAAQVAVEKIEKESWDGALAACSCGWTGTDFRGPEGPAQAMAQAREHRSFACRVPLSKMIVTFAKKVEVPD